MPCNPLYPLLARLLSLAFAAFLLGIASFSWAAPDGSSHFTKRLADERAVYLDEVAFGVAGDGFADDSAALQAAIDAVQERSEYGVLFVPEGQYRISQTLYVWKGIRLIGYGKKRPTIVLGANTPGYDSGDERYLMNFVSNRPRPGDPIRPANPGTFYSALSNIDIEIGDGNHAAIGVRSHFAQHCFLSHVDFRIGSGRAGVEKVGNEISDCRFFGGDYGIITTKPSPSWPFVMVDALFQGQREAAIRTEEGGLTLLRIHVKDTKSAVIVNPDRAEELYMENCRFENLSGPALVISDEYNARPQFNLRQLVARDVPALARFRKSGKLVKGLPGAYRVDNFTHGMQQIGLVEKASVRTTVQLSPLSVWPEAAASDVAKLPDQSEWVNVRSFGAIGDGQRDDTEALRAAIAAGRTVYLPTGRYRVSDTIELEPDTVLVGTSPIATQILIADYTPAFMGAAEVPKLNPERLRRWGLDPEDETVRRRFTPPVPAIAAPPKPLVLAPKGGRNVIAGIGLDTGGANPSAVALKWMAGEGSMVDDVRFLGGHGTYRADGAPVPVYNENRSADGDYRRRWDSQYASLWITDGGGGTFKNIWTPSPYAQAGIRITDTKAPGRLYQVSSEHHVRAEVQLKGVENWSFYALQFEEESGEGPKALPLEIEACRALLFANTYLYRVDRMVSPFPYGIKMRASKDIDFRGLHVYSPTKFSYDNTLYDETQDLEVRHREIARLLLTGGALRKDQAAAASEIFTGALKRIASGFEFIDGAAADDAGNVYFIDGRWHRIHRWSVAANQLELVFDGAIAPRALVCDASGNVIVLTESGRVFAFDPERAEESLEALEPVPAKDRPRSVAALPGHRWRDAHDVLPVASAESVWHALSPDSSVFVAGLEQLRRAFSLRTARPGLPFYLADEFGQKTWRFQVAADGSLSQPELFAEEGELGIAVGPQGRVYVAAGHVQVYHPSGEKLETLAVPERPATLAFGGPEGRSLFITARRSLFRIELADK